MTRYALNKIMGRLAGTRDVVYDTITLDEREARLGTKIAYLDERRSRRLNITIPPGMKEGQLIRLRGEGDSNGAGDIYFRIEVRRPFLTKVRELLKK
jgi:DnaJ-class molecular chaperone